MRQTAQLMPRLIPQLIPGAEVYRLPLRFKPELLHGTAGLPVGLASMGNLAGVALPAWGELKKA